MKPPQIHESATVEPEAVLGRGVRVWHHVHVQAGAYVGDDTTLGKDVFVARGARVGSRVKVQNGVSIYDGVTIEDDAFIGPHAVFTNVAAPRAFVTRMHERRETHIGQGATIGAGAIIVCGHRIGNFAFVGAGAVVTRDVPAHALVVGNPARRIGWVSRLGRKLAAADLAGETRCPESGELYRVSDDACVAVAAEPAEANAAVPFQNLAAQHTRLMPALRAAFERVARSGHYVLGPEVKALEAALAEQIGVRHAIGVSSGTDALLVSLMALGVGPGDEVITTPFSFFATTSVILRLGAKPVFADIDPVSFNLDPAALSDKISKHTRAILPVHLFGRPLSPELFEVAERHSVPVVEDAAQALGASNTRGSVGALGKLGCFSFFPTKNLGALGDGGLVTTSDDRLADRIRLLRVQGARPKYHHLEVGGNFRLDELQAALLLVKLPYYKAALARRRAIAARYEQALNRLSGLTPPTMSDGHVYHQYTVRHPERDALALHLKAAGIETAIYYPEPLHQMPALASHTPTTLPHAELACREVLSLPIHEGLTDAEVQRVVVAVLGFGGGS